MDNLEQKVADLGWKMVYTNVTVDTKPFWGADSKKKILYIFNTKDYVYINDFIDSFKRSYLK